MASHPRHKGVRLRRWSIRVAALLVGTLLVSPTVQSAQPAHATSGTFVNPIIPGDSNVQPNMYFKDGWYYNVQHTGDNTSWNKIAILKSRTLTGIWYPEGAATIYTYPSNFSDAWVPVMQFFNSKWYIYDSVQDNSFSPAHRVLTVFESNTSDPLGAWTYKGVFSAVSNFAYDPNVLQKSDGTLYLVYAANPSGALIGFPDNLYITTMSNPYTLSGSPILLAKPGYAHPSDAAADPGLAWEGTTNGNLINEAPAFLYRNGKINLVYSGNQNSCTCYAWGLMTNTDGNVTNPASWTKRGATGTGTTSPVFQSGGGVSAPGNHFFTKSPDGMEDWAVYSAPTPSFTRGEVLTQKFTWNADDTPNFGTPKGNAVPQTPPSSEPTLSPYQLNYNAEYQNITHATIYDQTPQLGAGAMGWQSVGGLSFSDSKVVFNYVKAPLTASYFLVVRYSNQSGVTATQPIKINGVSITSPTLPVTTNWETFSNVTLTVTLNQGTNTVEFDNNGGNARIDGFQVAYQSANFAALSGGTTQVARSNAANGWVAGTMTTSSSCVTDWRVWGLQTANTIGIRYSAPAAASVTVSVNGGTAVPVTLPSTGSSNTFSVAVTTATLVPMSWNLLQICRATGSPEIDVYVWG